MRAPRNNQDIGGALGQDMGSAFIEIDLIHDGSNRQSDDAELLVTHCERSEQ